MDLQLILFFYKPFIFFRVILIFIVKNLITRKRKNFSAFILQVSLSTILSCLPLLSYKTAHTFVYNWSRISNLNANSSRYIIQILPCRYDLAFNRSYIVSRNSIVRFQLYKDRTEPSNMAPQFLRDIDSTFPDGLFSATKSVPLIQVKNSISSK